MPVAADGSFSYSTDRIAVQGRFVSPDNVEGTVRVDPARCAQSSGLTRQWAGVLQSPDDPGAMVRPQPAGPGCETQVTVGTRTAWSTCFRRADDAWTSDVPVRLGGIDLEPREGAIRLTEYLVAGRPSGRPALRVLVDGPEVRLRGLRRRTTGTITVRAISPRGGTGESARVKLKRARGKG